jgi:MarR family transcriptional regulator for hemolysin
MRDYRNRRGPAITHNDNPKRSIALKLFALARQIRLGFDQGVKKNGVTRAKWTLIAAVARNPGATQRTIAAALEVTEVTAGRMIDCLCATGHLERRENPNDRRGYRVYLTPEAQPILDRLGEVAEVLEDELFEAFDEEDLARLESLLDRISRNVTESRKRHSESKPAGEYKAG